MKTLKETAEEISEKYEAEKSFKLSPLQPSKEEENKRNLLEHDFQVSKMGFYQCSRCGAIPTVFNNNPCKPSKEDKFIIGEKAEQFYKDVIEPSKEEHYWGGKSSNFHDSTTFPEPSKEEPEEKDAFYLNRLFNEAIEEVRKEERTKVINEIREWIDNSEWDGNDVNAIMEYLTNKLK